MRYGASTFIWVSPFSNNTLDLIDRAKAFGFSSSRSASRTPKPSMSPRFARGPRPPDWGSPSAALSARAATFPPKRRQCARTVSPTLSAASTSHEGLGSPFVSGPMYAGGRQYQNARRGRPAAQWARAVTSLKQAAAYAADRHVKLAIEPLNRFETDLVNTVDQGIRMIADVGASNVGLLLDTFHMNIEEKDLPAAIRRAAGHIVEFHACSSDRGTPGEDHLPWRAIAAALRDARYDGPIVIEAFTPEIKEIARAVSIWRPLAAGARMRLARDGLANLRDAFEASSA